MNSLVAQDYSSFEVIIVDDGSSIDLSPVIMKYSELIPLTFIRIHNSGGPARPRNIGIQYAQANWVALLDSDDWWSASKLTEVANAIKLIPNADLFYHKLKITSNSLRKKWWQARTLGKKISGDEFLSLMINGNSIPNSSVVFRKNCTIKYGLINEAKSLQSVEDFDYWLNLAHNKCNFVFIPKILGYYSLEGDGISSDYRKAILRNKKLLKKYINFLDVSKRSFAISRYQYFAGSVLYYANLPDKASKYLFSAKSLNHIIFRLKRIYKLIRIYFQV